MTPNSLDYARSQADGLDNIAPTTLQGQQAWQFAQSDNFLSSEEASAVRRKQLEPYRTQLGEKLAQIGYPPEHLATRPDVRDALFCGEKTAPMKLAVASDVQLEGSLRIVMTESGPEIRVTPVQRELTIPDQIQGVQLAATEKQQLLQDGFLPRPLVMLKDGEYAPTYLRVDSQTNSLELLRVKAEHLPTKLLGIDLTKDQQLQLAYGYPVRLSGLLDNQGTPFNATVSISPEKQSLQFADVNRISAAVKPDEEFKGQLAHNNDGAKTDQTRGSEVAFGSSFVNKQQAEVVGKLLTDDSRQPDNASKLRHH